MQRKTYATLITHLNLMAEKPDREQLLKNLQQQINEKKEARQAQKQEFTKRTKAPAQAAYEAKPQQNRQVHQPVSNNGQQNRGMGRKI